jgi:hypothetical protein
MPAVTWMQRLGPRFCPCCSRPFRNSIRDCRLTRQDCPDLRPRILPARTSLRMTASRNRPAGHSVAYHLTVDRINLCQSTSAVRTQGSCDPAFDPRRLRERECSCHLRLRSSFRKAYRPARRSHQALPRRIRLTELPDLNHPAIDIAYDSL